MSVFDDRLFLRHGELGKSKLAKGVVKVIGIGEIIFEKRHR